MKKKDATPKMLIIYTTVTAGYYREGNLDEVFRLHVQMIEEGSSTI
ncbi:unnamed protein product [Brassica rapa]|uniref:Pentatricopeptide repeat-containing protein n=1 Tax=Brassica campestris TaxID=3711 RepID=A0A8D9GHT0_BRACM|nr:unnamed protein product [Brassica rapa]